MKTSYCNHCSKRLPIANFTNFCDSFCEETYKMNMKPKKVYNSNCLYCKKIFLTTNGLKKYCSQKCANENYAKNNPKVYSNQYTVSRFKIFARDNFQCIYCGKSSIEDKQELHLEHIYPRSKGGNNSVSNLVTSCKVCNLEKSARELDNDILERIYKVVKERNDKYFKDIDTKELEVEFDKMYKYEKIN